MTARDITRRSLIGTGVVGAGLVILTSGAVVSEADEIKDAAYTSATIESGATSASFKIAVSSSVPSDNSPQKVPITSASLKATPEYLTVPKRQAAAFLTSKVVNSSDFPFLAGAMNVFLDGTFVGTSALPFGSDAHVAERIGARFASAMEVAEAAGFRPGRDLFDFWRV